jgi:hypothetical protein
VVVWKLDRISRRQREGVNLLADWCERGVRVVVITQQLDLSGAVGRLVASVLFGLAEIEHEYRRERQAAGIAVAKQKGRYHGRVQGTTKAQPSAPGYCMSVASPWRRFGRLCRLVRGPSIATWPQGNTRERFTAVVLCASLRLVTRVLGLGLLGIILDFA